MAAPRTTAEAVEVPPAEAIAYLRQKTNITSRHWDEVWQEAHARAFTVAGAASDALVRDFRDAVAKALEQGTTLQAFRGEFDRIVAEHGWTHHGTPAWRAQIIYETNLATAYSAGRYAQMTEPATLAAFPYWQYMHTSSAHPRPLHLLWVGTTLRADDPWWDSHYPPNGWNCRCGVRPVSGRGLARMGKSGPDTAPPIVEKPWTNPRTGQTVEVPEGIDPGWAYNPGKTWVTAERGAEPHPSVPRPARLPAQTAFPREFGTLDAADEAATEMWAPWAEGLSRSQAELLDAYKGDAGAAMNAALRGEAESPGLLAAAQDLATALDRAVAPESVRTFRGVGEDEIEALFPAHRQVGDIVATEGFLSTSLSETTARDFATLKAPGDPVVITVLIPRGLRGGAYVNPFPVEHHREFEMLLRPGMGLRILTLGVAGIVVEAQNGPIQD